MYVKVKSLGHKYARQKVLPRLIKKDLAHKSINICTNLFTGVVTFHSSTEQNFMI